MHFITFCTLHLYVLVIVIIDDCAYMYITSGATFIITWIGGTFGVARANSIYLMVG